MCLLLIETIYQLWCECTLGTRIIYIYFRLIIVTNLNDFWLKFLPLLVISWMFQYLLISFVILQYLTQVSDVIVAGVIDG